MNNFSCWKKNQKKLKTNLSYAEIIRLGGRKKWYDQICPEWIWTAFFVGFIIALVVMVVKMDRIEPGEVKEWQEVQLGQEVIKTPLDAKITATGVASWYDYNPNGWNGMKNGDYSKIYDTCATRGWNRNGWMKVTNLANGKSVECRVNDDGPRDCEYRYKYGLDKPGECVERLIDLSSHAFKQIGDLGNGLINVKVEEI